MGQPSSLSLLLNLDRYLDEFERQWCEHRCPVLTEFLESVPEEIRRRAAYALIAIDADYRRSAGDQVAACDYKSQLPELDVALIDAAIVELPKEASLDKGSQCSTQMLSGVPTDAFGSALRLPRDFGNYELLAQVGVGGMGIVYRARQRGINRTVALKMIRSGRFASADELRRFKTEAGFAAQLDHPGIVPIYEVGEHEGQPFFTMALVEGKSLADRLVSGPIDPEIAVRLAISICDAVHYAHIQKVIHRDLKPDNILLISKEGKDNDNLSDDGRNGGADSAIQGEFTTKITDFGLAKALDHHSQLTSPGQILGTPSFMPPEQARGHDTVSIPADVYSLGAVLYAMLTGRPPFQSAHPVETIAQVINQPPPRPSLLNPSLDDELDHICLKCLRKDPKQRYKSVADLSSDLQRYCSRSIRPGRRLLGRLSHLSPSRMALGLAFILVVVMALTVYRVLASQSTEADLHEARAIASILNVNEGTIVPPLESLEALPRPVVLRELRGQLAIASEPRKLPLAFALSKLGEVDVDYLIARIESAWPDEVKLLVESLACVRSEALIALKRSARRATELKQWKFCARLAIVAVQLGDKSIAEGMCQNNKEPDSRSWLINECSRWHGPLIPFASAADQTKYKSLRNALILAIGSIPPKDISQDEFASWKPIFLKYYHANDVKTHSAAAYASRRWSIDLPSPPQTAYLPPGRQWHVNTVGMKMVKIPKGSFIRIDPATGKPLRTSHETRISHSFLMAEREITNALFQRFLDDRNYDSWKKPTSWLRADPSFGDSADHPATCNWDAAIEFCNWLSTKEGLQPCYVASAPDTLLGHPAMYTPYRIVGTSLPNLHLPKISGYRLPTEAEWEYACRAGTITPFSFGSDESLATEYAHLKTFRVGRVATRLPNPWGLFDMHGNVAEWCYDRFTWYEYSFSKQRSLTDPVSDGKGLKRVIRGGSFVDEPSQATSGTRGEAILLPYERELTKAYLFYGIRLVRTLVDDTTEDSLNKE